MNYIGIIPARYSSTRFPGKPLDDLGGKPMIQWVYENTLQSLDNVIVATDHPDIESAVKDFGGKVIMTSPEHPSGTDRCAEVIEILQKNGESYDVALNIQGDLRTSDHFCELKRRVLSYIGTSDYSKQNQHLHYDLIAEYFLYFSPDSEIALNWAKKHWQQQKTPRDARLLLKVAIAANDEAVIEEVQHWQAMFQTEDKSQQHLFKDSILALY